MDILHLAAPCRNLPVTFTLYAVKPSVIPLVAGALCLPMTYRLTRYGSGESLAASVAIIVATAMLGTWLALWYMNRKNCQSAWWALTLAFVGGAGLSEVLFFAYYYFDYGHADQKLSVGIALSFIEGGAIAMLGGLSVVVSFFALRRITSASRATR